MRVRSLGWWILACGIVGTMACHHRPDRVTWERAHPGLLRAERVQSEHQGARETSEAEPPPRRDAQPIPAATVNPTPASTEHPQDVFGGGANDASTTSAGLQIDRALLEFQSRRVSARRHRSPLSVRVSHWVAVLTAIEDACSKEPVADDFGAFVRARTILDVERQKDREAGHPLKDKPSARLDHVFDMMDARVAELRLASGRLEMGPTVIGGDGVIVFHSPLSTMVVTSPFGLRVDPITGKKRFHAGVDFGAPLGTSIAASADGVVVYAGWQGGYGRHVVIEHGHGVRSHYSHMESIYVAAGEKLEAGRVLGGVGASGRATGPHLHFAVTNEKGRFIDPVVAMQKPVVVEGAAQRTVATVR